MYNAHLNPFLNQTNFIGQRGDFKSFVKSAWGNILPLCKIPSHVDNLPQWLLWVTNPHLNKWLYKYGFVCIAYKYAFSSSTKSWNSVCVLGLFFSDLWESSVLLGCKNISWMAQFFSPKAQYANEGLLNDLVSWQQLSGGYQMPHRC